VWLVDPEVIDENGSGLWGMGMGMRMEVNVYREETKRNKAKKRGKKKANK